MATCLVFPGQGSQSVGMCRGIYERSAAAKGIIDCGQRTLRDLMFNGPKEELDKTANAQPAIFLGSQAYFEALREHYCSLDRNLEYSFVVGHSVGTYAALAASGAISFEDGLSATCKRGTAMGSCIERLAQQEQLGTMTAILSRQPLPLGEIERICTQTISGSQRVYIANDNSANQVVLSGSEETMPRVIEEIKKKVGKVAAIFLDVEGAFHSPYMFRAVSVFQTILPHVTIRKPSAGYISDARARFLSEPEEIRQSLAEQITGRVRWRESIELAVEEGVDTFVEVGAGKVLSNLLKKSLNDGSSVVHADEILGLDNV